MNFKTFEFPKPSIPAVIFRDLRDPAIEFLVVFAAGIRSRGLRACVLLMIFGVSSTQAAVGISTPSVVSGELIRAADWNKVKLDLESLAAAVGVLQNSTWGSSGADTYYNAGNVGIGTTLPAANVHIYADAPAANAVLFQIGTSDDADRVRIDEDGDMTIDGKLVVRDSDIYESGGDLELSGEDSLYLTMDWNNNDGDTQNILFGKNSAGAGANFVELMRLQEDGDVGIGTATPASKLQVAGAIQVGADAGACAAGKAGAMRYNGGAIERCDGAAWDALATTNVSDNMGSHVATQDLDLDTFKLVGNGGTEGLTIAADGKVGVSAASAPTEILDVNGFIATQGIKLGTGAASANQPSITFAEAGAITANLNSFSGGLNFDLPTQGSANRKMTIRSDGKVGIGTPLPSALLQVYKVTPNANEIVFQVGTDGDATRFTVDEDGDVFNDGNYYVGGGNIISSNGSVTVGGEDNLYLSADWNDNDTDSRSIVFGKNGVGGGTGWEELARINENGRLGVGIITPANKMHVVENISTDRVATFENAATTGSPEGLLVLTGQGAGPGAAFAVGTGTEATHTKKFVVTNQGYVGIGDSTGTNPLMVKAENSATSIAKFRGYDTNNNLHLILENTAGTPSTSGLKIREGLTDVANLRYSSPNSAWHVYAGGSDVADLKMVVEDTGNVGIGTTSPLVKLQVEGADKVLTIRDDSRTGAGAQAYLTFEDAAGTLTGYIGDGSTGTSNLNMYTPNTLDIRADTGYTFNIAGGARAVTIDNTGNVGIGTTSPGEKLEINGAIKLGLNGSQVAIDFPSGGSVRTGSSGTNVYLDAGTLWVRDGNGVSANAQLKVMGETSVSGISADGTGKVVCIKADSNLGTCTDAPNGSGVCTCS